MWFAYDDDDDDDDDDHDDEHHLHYFHHLYHHFIFVQKSFLGITWSYTIFRKTLLGHLDSRSTSLRIPTFVACWATQIVTSLETEMEIFGFQSDLFIYIYICFVFRKLGSEVIVTFGLNTPSKNDYGSFVV